jgi:putative ABC transport system permease protein
MVLAGAVAGLVLGTVSIPYIEGLLYGVDTGDPAALAAPALTIIAAALIAAVPAVVRALRIDPAKMLRSE